MTSLSRAAFGVLAATMLAGCGSAVPVSVAVPDVVGQALDAAKTALVTAGFASYPQDLLRDRNPLLDSDWTVCTQTPGPVAAAVAGSTVDLGVVKKAEACPDPTGASTAAASGAAAPTTAASAHAAERTPAARNTQPRSTPKPRPSPAPQAAGTGTSSGGATAVGTVRSGTFCDPPATGVSDRGTAMACAPAADGRNRWRRA